MGRMKDLLYLDSGEAEFDEVAGKSISDDSRSDESCCWADVWDDHRNDYRPCEYQPDEESALGLCANHATLLTFEQRGAEHRSIRQRVVRSPNTTSRSRPQA